MFLRLTVGLLIAFFLTSCGSSAESKSNENQNKDAIAVAILNSAPTIFCPNGGLTVQSGIDTNTNYVLEPIEATSVQYVCNGIDGSSGSNVRMVIANEPLGANCAAGGSLINVGLDLNRNDILETLEITSFSYVCKGASGLNGFDGTNGANGLSNISRTVTESVSANCNFGGQKTTMGLDINSNLQLDLNEVASTTYVCNGANGHNGTNGNNGTNGSNGLNGLNSLIAIHVLDNSKNCLDGGSELTAGLDVNSNQVLEAEEITSRTYICNVSNTAKSAYAYIYNLSAQVVALDAPISFDSNGLLSELQHELGTAEIQVLVAGTYTLAFSISGTEPNQFAIFVNDKLVQGSIYGSGAGTQQNYGQITLELAAKDVLTVMNYGSDSAVTLASNIGGKQANVNASVSIQKID